MLNNTISVSYTHLDVYKRQVVYDRVSEESRAKADAALLVKKKFNSWMLLDDMLY